jgi:hypothetical protein
MQYHLSAVNATATAAVPRVVDTHGLLHVRRVPKSARACNAADAIDGITILGSPTLKLAAVAFGVSVGSVARALRLTPAQRQAVRQGMRPLVLPPAPPVPTIVPATPPAPPVTMGARERLKEIVHEIGFEATLNLLAASEKVAA